ncbi:DC-STAMP domain-containing protein 2 [Sphaerodactylus townsendi]|uniref:DC-STAMP domain-containing protein 2 n=1 Tax=Sphaerodactylus townsendi TaxID=933632 RepID=UPI00202613E0|nr:DC-STAMP domain-containing protein 2 [Sphaerodactylus townsendi]
MGLLSNFSMEQAKEMLQRHLGKKRRKKKPLGLQVSEDTMGRRVMRSVGGFALGMTIAALYGALVIFVQGYNIWYCLVSTISLAAGLGFGMAFSYKVRVTVLLVVPQMFSRETKAILLVLAFGLAMQGPFANIVRNFSRSAEAVSCGAELALNQTAEMLQRARQPLLTALQKIKDIAKKAKVVGDRVRKLFRSVMDSVRHVAHCLRNVWYWLVNLGEICNHELGTPYRKCVRVFDNAKEECERAIPFLYLFCYIVLLFKPLCGLANILLVFCIIPQYIVPFLRRNVGAPISNMLGRIRREFEFNITTIHNYDVTVNASKSLSQVAFDIMEDISLRLQPVREAVGLFGYMSTLAILYVYVRALLYRKCYLHEESFDNIYITRQFVEMDTMRRKHRRPTVLPLSAKESAKYIRPASLVLPRHERLRYTLALASIFRQLIIVVLLIVGDYSVFWLFDLVRYQLHGEIVARAPVTMSVSVTGTGYSGEMYRDMVSAFDVLQRGNISVLSKKCHLHPSEPDYGGYIVIGVMYGTCLFIAVCGSYVQRLRRAVCAWYYPSREQERICYLYNTILTRRTTLLGAVLKAVRRNSADGGHTNLFLILAAKVPVLNWIVKRLGVHQSYCLGCGSVRKDTDSEDFVTCSTPGCRGIYCPKCYQLLNNVCSVCMGPLTFQGDMDEEMKFYTPFHSVAECKIPQAERVSRSVQKHPTFSGEYHPPQRVEKGASYIRDAEKIFEGETSPVEELQNRKECCRRKAQGKSDSSDSEAMDLQMGAIKALRGVPSEERQEQRRRLKHRIKRAAKGQGAGRRLPPDVAQKMLDRLKEEGSSSSEDSEESSAGDSSAPSSGSSSSLDFAYQGQAEASGSEGPTPESEELEEVKSEAPPLQKEVKSEAPPLQKEVKSEAPPLQEELKSEAPPLQEELKSEAPPLQKEAKSDERPRQEENKEEKSDRGPKQEMEERQPRGPVGAKFLVKKGMPAGVARTLGQRPTREVAFPPLPTPWGELRVAENLARCSVRETHQGAAGAQPDTAPALAVPKNKVQQQRPRARPVTPVRTGTALGGENASAPRPPPPSLTPGSRDPRSALTQLLFSPILSTHILRMFVPTPPRPMLGITLVQNYLSPLPLEADKGTEAAQPGERVGHSASRCRSNSLVP